jgi:XTP/dITP diphosphohydrolase
MNQLIFATNNQHKVDEVKALLAGILDVISLKDAAIDIDIPEPHDRLEENADEKSRCIYALSGKNCFSEDTGLEVDALQGAPGVRSARYCSSDEPFKDNTEKLLFQLNNVDNRKAQFRTIISLILDGTTFQFEGICEGHISTSKSGDQGFGYDPIFIPAGSQQSFAEMTLQEKNKFSHRKKAVFKLISFLQQYYGQN